MIVRIWHGWTLPGNAAAYETLLHDEVFPGIAERSGDGLLAAELLRRPSGNEVEFVTLLRFVSLDAVKALAGEDLEQAHVPESARQLLSRYDERVAHYALALPQTER